ncbi:MAG TPA: hypothetical protein VNS79_05180 [Sphingobium sp.]|nr:hypothetical protein [Sphingobium sp.]
MMHFTHKMSRRLSAVMLTLLFSTIAVLGAIGPGYTGPASSQTMATMGYPSGESANTLA